MNIKKVVIGTRGSSLALQQTEQVSRLLHAFQPGLEVEVRIIHTRGDLVRDRPLAQVGGKGLFVKEIESALLSGEIDMAVHSLKDMPTEQPQGLALGAILEREDHRDALVVRGTASDLSSLPPAARVGTGSLRRRAQLLAARPDLQVLDLRGNVDTRLHKLHEGQYDAVVLAVAGLVRLGHAAAITQFLPVETMVPAVGQGALCVEVREGNEALGSLLAHLDHPATRHAATAERAFLRRLEGGCQVPIGAHAEVRDDGLDLEGLIAAPDGSRLVRDTIHGPAASAAVLGTDLAEYLLAMGGHEILEEARLGS